MSSDEQQPLDAVFSLKLQVLPLIYAVTAILSLIATAGYASGVAFFADVGNERAAVMTVIVALGALALTVGSVAAAYGLSRRARWSWYVAAGVALVWTANGIRVVLREVLVLPSSLVIGLTMLWLLWGERDALGVDSDDPVSWARL